MKHTLTLLAALLLAPLAVPPATDAPAAPVKIRVNGIMHVGEPITGAASSTSLPI